MSKQQTRRSISVSGETYSRLKAWCVENNRSMSGVVEECLSDYLMGGRKSKIKERVSFRSGNVTSF